MGGAARAEPAGCKECVGFPGQLRKERSCRQKAQHRQEPPGEEYPEGRGENLGVSVDSSARAWTGPRLSSGLGREGC